MRRVRILGGQVSIAVIAFVLWELADRSGAYGIWISSPARIGGQLCAWLAGGNILVHLWATLEELLLGYAFGMATGVVLGLTIGLTPRGGRAWDPLIQGVNGVPRFALAPLFIVWLGTGLESKVVLVATAVGYIVLSTTLDGVRRVDRDLITSVRVMGASQAQVLRPVVVPAALSAIVLGARLAIPYGLVAAVAADFLMGMEGLWFLISRVSGYLEMDQLFAAIVVVMAIGVALNLLLAGRVRSVESTGQVAGKSW